MVKYYKVINIQIIIQFYTLPIKASGKPYIHNTVQWIVLIIDQSKNHGEMDTRFESNGVTTTGLGSEILRIYTTPYGSLQGYTWSTEETSKYIDKF